MLQLKELLKKLIEFREKRDWTKYHTPENLAKSISIEASELLLNYQWENNPNIDNVKEELADIMIYCLYLMDYYNFELEEMVLSKLEKNAIKYPLKDTNET